MVNRTMKPNQALQVVRRTAREHGMSVVKLTNQGKSQGKGSHTMYALVDSSGHEVARFGLTGHARDLSWGVFRKLEDGLTPWFGEKWTEKR